MDKCTYHSRTKIVSKEASPDRQVKGVRFRQKCLHPSYRNTLFNKLECDGDLAKCCIDWDAENP